MTSIAATPTVATPTKTGADGTQYSTGVDRTAMDTDTFLKLLVAQLKYQDPSNPTDTTQFMSQTAQFTAVEKTTQLKDLTQKVLDAQLTQTGTSLVGKTVTYNDASGTAHTGLVSGCTIGATTPNLTIDGVSVLLTAVTGVTTPPPSSTPATADPSADPSADPTG
jgi:flagellar basal-body rod modification protein FlgD